MVSQEKFLKKIAYVRKIKMDEKKSFVSWSITTYKTDDGKFCDLARDVTDENKLQSIEKQNRNVFRL